MLGNDVVDLRDVDAQPESFRPRFDERVFSPLERRAIERDAHPHARRWAHWAAKEAAYKLARQVDPAFVFSPGSLVARFGAAVEGAAMASRSEPPARRGRPRGDATRIGVLSLPEAIAPGLRDLELRSFETAEHVHVLALPIGGDWDAVVFGIEAIGSAGGEDSPGADGLDALDSSGLVRALAVRRIARDLGIDASRITIGKRGRIPTVSIDGARSSMSISLSHHGRFVACAMQVRESGTTARARGTSESGAAEPGPDEGEPTGSTAAVGRDEGAFARDSAAFWQTESKVGGVAR